MEEIITSLKGPLFDHRAIGALEGYSKAVEEALTTKATSELKETLQGSFKHSTGAYIAGIQQSRHGDTVSIHNNMVYSRWLEGTSSRNDSTSFKGYHSFEKTDVKINVEAKEIAEKILPAFLGKME